MPGALHMHARCTAYACQVHCICMPGALHMHARCTAYACQVRCIELHRYARGGGLTELAHKDCGSTLTLSVQVKARN